MSTLFYSFLPFPSRQRSYILDKPYSTTRATLTSLLGRHTTASTFVLYIRQSVLYIVWYSRYYTGLTRFTLQVFEDELFDYSSLVNITNNNACVAALHIFVKVDFFCLKSP